jgi:hypothetical protein
VSTTRNKLADKEDTMDEEYEGDGANSEAVGENQRGGERGIVRALVGEHDTPAETANKKYTEKRSIQHTPSMSSKKEI